jgi:hypothetical protein
MWRVVFMLLRTPFVMATAVMLGSSSKTGGSGRVISSIGHVDTADESTGSPTSVCSQPMTMYAVWLCLSTAQLLFIHKPKRVHRMPFVPEAHLAMCNLNCLQVWPAVHLIRANQCY